MMSSEPEAVEDSLPRALGVLLDLVGPVLRRQLSDTEARLLATASGTLAAFAEAIAKAVAERSTLSDREVARRTGRSHPLIGRWRRAAHARGA